MPFAQTKDAKLHYDVGGAGEDTLILVQGLGGHASEWGNAYLTRLRSQLRVVVLDNRGIGESETQVERWTLEDMADDALAVLDAIGCERAFVGGTSMGGMIAQLIAIHAPARVRALALMATSFGGAEAVPPSPETNALFTPLPNASAGALQRRSLRLLTAPGFADENPALIDELADLRERTRTRAAIFQAQFNALLASDRSQTVRGLGLPVLVLHGEDDLLIPVENGRLLAARITGAELVLLPSCGHFPHLEKPHETADTLLRFFFSHRAR